MDKRLKYIKVTGHISEIGSFTSTKNGDQRAYESVTIVDEVGNELHFKHLILSTRMDSKIKNNQPAIFYILRTTFNKELRGTIYALEVNGEKYFYEKEAVSMVKAMSACCMRRNICWEPLCTPVVLLFIALLALIPVIGWISAPAILAWICYPMFMQGKFVGIENIHAIMKEEGFFDRDIISGKY